MSGGGYEEFEGGVGYGRGGYGGGGYYGKLIVFFAG